MLRTPLRVRNEYQGDVDPGPPLTPEELVDYGRKVEELEATWSKLLELASADAFTNDEWVTVLERLEARSHALTPFRDRIAKELDDQFNASETPRVLAQYNLGKKFIEKKKVIPRDNSLRAIFERHLQKQETNPQRKTSRATDREEG